MDKFKIFKERLKGASIIQLSITFNITAEDVHEAIADTLIKIVESNRLSLKQLRDLELERLDYMTAVAEEQLRTSSDDILDPESGKLLRDGLRSKIALLRTLLDISKQRAVLLQFNSLKEDVKTESARLFDQLKSVDLESIDSLEDLLEFNKTLQSL